jgi:L-ascorbate metabolism protein UlaG (beta-lactamase superfamily)
MQLTKYRHACLTIEKDDQIIVIDPGAFSTDFITPERVVAVIITHEHTDHFDHEQLAAIIDKNPDAIIIAHESITAQIEVFETRSVTAGESMAIGPFSLAFLGGQHALIHPSMPLIANLGVFINDLFYYPGDSFVLPDTSVDTLALPANAPWMKISEAMDFLATVKPRFAFPTHDGLLSDEGKMVTNGILTAFAASNNIEYQPLTDPITI